MQHHVARPPEQLPLLAAVSLAWLCAAPALARIEVPTRFVAGGVYVALKSKSGATTELYTDTGGGGLVLARRSATRLGLHITKATDPEVIAELGPEAAQAEPPELTDGMPPLPSPAIVAERATQVPSWPEQADGFLGAPWFAGRVWTWDYLHQKLFLEGPDWHPARHDVAVELGFRAEADGKRTTNFARMPVTVDGVTIQVLLDTGAETVLTPAAQAIVGGPAMQATSMVASRRFQNWHRTHPQWLYVPAAQLGTGAAMIRVPHVEIAGFDIGQLWFTERPNGNYDQYMSSMMDRPVEGSVGGNAFLHLVMTIDYPRATAYFSRRTAHH